MCVYTHTQAKILEREIHGVDHLMWLGLLITRVSLISMPPSASNYWVVFLKDILFAPLFPWFTLRFEMICIT